jgi:hypothetical protein
MTEWWTYRPSDFVMVAPRTYWRLMERHNLAAWPVQPALIGLGLVLLALAARGGPRAQRGVAAVVAALWLAVGWFFHAQRYAEIHTAAWWFGALFAVQALLLALAAAAAALPCRPTWLGTVLMAGAVLAAPLLGLATGRALAQAEVLGLMPDPTVLFTLGLLAGPVAPACQVGWRRALRWACWPIPLGWSLGSGLTLWNLQAPEAALLPLAALAALVALGIASRAQRVADPQSTRQNA